MPDGFGLYVHIPYCRTHCPYCDFNVVAGARWPERRYTDALLAEIAHHAQSPPFAARTIDTVFFGGGTPSLFSPQSIERVLDAARRAFGVDRGAEVSLEANPETLTAESLSGYRAAGVDRLSIGIESFQPRLLKRLARLQTAAETRLAVGLAREAGFANVSLDLMFAIPGQSLDDWRADLDAAVALRPDHLSAYGLTYEEGTPFFDLRRKGRLEPLDDDTEAAMFEEARARLGAAGYRAYEVSNFALPGCESRHNLNYWRGGAYLGIGAGAHSHQPLRRGAHRWWNERDPQTYARRALAEGAAVAGSETLDLAAAAREYAFLALRTAEGLEPEAFRARFGAGFEELFPETCRMVGEGLLKRSSGGRLALTRRGLLLADAVFASVL